ncbi:succinate dehydrogenase, hydrophobic membrane anchor protein [Parapusillimonas granuli]|uniref:Succinate dehydrogenase hydrophobic membrane anchor subunit n=1 Tax=Parapusillimonas granuli TaxID=380911 RepID=A0A853FXM7_9BURK|nr:succinate dehydrogenase, hydrophobic membrane anchor protein [Parapusillimonas granuli]MBB5213594.1 succinate dehydrogenase / fumarate reductase membrane anchor subunit [Parapusillimonas granuli]MEB2398687.1 succinate dehydrogenase, hydrophobic membrane anchor protein [Alcaligenaceae bacterium]NYT48432.1 succinate dehydrogenase, hydrophobic membrane anchor protein [Parapusillimonas granuli]
MSTQERIGTKRLVVGAHYGTVDFIVQRVTAIIMAVYTIVLLVGILFTSEINFDSWRRLFTFTWVGLPVGQMLATLAFFSLVWHAWIGVRDIWMDYIHSVGLRLFLQVLTILWLVATVVYFAKILWSL